MATVKEIRDLTGAKLPVMEAFETIQGEGRNAGMASWFIRLGGCDVGCTWCDVKESWDAAEHEVRDVDDIVSEALGSSTDLVVVTGGEPAMYDLGSLTKGLVEGGKKTAVETSGAYPLTGEWHWICFSPKKFKQPIDQIYKEADELKVVVFNKHDLKWAEEHASKVRKECLLYLQPEWSREKEMLPLIIDFVKQHPQWRISLQTHKYMNIP